MDLLIREELSAVSNPRWVGLEGHAASLQKQKRWDEITLQAKAAVEFTGSPANYMEAAINVLCRVSPSLPHSVQHTHTLQMTTNAFRLTLADNTPIGLCFEPVLSLANHSCTPNATIMFDGRRIELRALDRIAKDGQIFISYIDPTQARSVRQEELQSRYFFMCECGKCVGDDGAYETFLKTEIVPWSQMDLFIEPQALRDFAASQCERKRYVTPITIKRSQIASHHTDQSSSTALTPTSTPAHTPTPVALQALYLAHLDNAQYLPALLLLLHIHIRHGVYLYPQPHHPVRVVQLFTLARLLTTVSSLQAPQAPQTSPSPSSPNPSFNYDRIMLGIDPPLRGDASRVLGELDIVSAVQILLSFVRELAGRSHGVESAFVREVEAELRDVERVQRERGVVGERLRGWAVDGDVEGREFARRVLGGLRALEKLGESVGRAAVR
jgi:hypothetical protein